MKDNRYQILVLIISYNLLVACLHAQNCNQFLLRNRIFAKGKISLLLDTITILENLQSINNNENYSEIKKIKGTHYRLSYIERVQGGLVDPAFYKYPFIIKQNKKGILLKFEKKKDRYTCQLKNDSIINTITFIKVKHRK